MANRRVNAFNLGGNPAGGRVPVASSAVARKRSRIAGKVGPSGDELMEGGISRRLSDKVFEDKVLREMILQNVIFSNTGIVSTFDLQSVRLVRKSWLITTAICLRQLKLPMFHLILDAGDSTSAKLLDDFLRFMASPTRFLNFIPPFSLHLTPVFFRKTNYPHLSRCLRSCGEALINFDLSFPVSCSMPLKFQSLQLPQLQRLSVHYSDYPLFGFRDSREKSVNLLQNILKASQDLQELILKYTPKEILIPSDFKTLSLPNSMTKLSFNCPLEFSHLELLIRNELPNLVSLSLFANSTIPYAPQMIFTILEKFRTSLRQITLSGDKSPKQLRKTLVRFPIMKSLQSLTITSQSWEFEEEVIFQLERQLPKMRSLEILNILEQTFEKWTKYSMFPRLKNLSVAMANSKTPTLGSLERLHHTFPNVVSLEITISEPMVTGLKYLFNNMRILRKLVIILEGDSLRVQEQHGPFHWDSVLTGLSEDLVIAFRRNREDYEAMDVRDDARLVSIRKLSALKSLTLREAFTPIRNGPVPDWPLISDLTFHFGFLKMQKLVNLQFHRRFKASEQMADRWRIEKGTEIKGTTAGR